MTADRTADELGPVPAAARLVDDVDVGETGGGDAVAHRPREADLLAAAIQADDPGRVVVELELV